MIKKIKFSYAEWDAMSKKSQDFFLNGWCRDDSQRDCWCSKDAILDNICDLSDGKIDFGEIPESWWEESGITGQLRKQMENLWEEDPEYEVVGAVR